MLNLKLCVAILLLSLVRQTVAFQIFNGSCPKMTSMGQFDMERYLGKWYVVEMFRPFTKPIPKCKSNDYGKDIKGHYLITSREIENATLTIKKRTLKIQKVNSEVGQYVLKHNQKTFPSGVEIYILATDYTSYTIEYTCINSNAVFSMQWAVIMTRKRVPTEGTIYIARKLAKKLGLQIYELEAVHQESCTI
ncbi:hypothetical protein KR044_005256 [Drosophila immigrans]|nr:hypothetical protein KR044_005256 [Drosophila immigrans]